MHPFVVLIDMDKDYKTFFTNSDSPEPPNGLLEKIILRIHREQKLLSVKRRLALVMTILIGSAVMAVPAFRLMQTNLTESGFTAYFSLIISDAAAILPYWRSFVWALAESLPIINIALFLAAVFVFLQALKFAVRDLKSVFLATNYN